MTEFTDQRAIRRYGQGFMRARDILTVAMIVADADGRADADRAAEIAGLGARLPGLGRIDALGLRKAGLRALSNLEREGVEAVFDRIATRLDKRDAAAALLLAHEVAQAGGPEAEAVLRPMARRLGVGSDRLGAIGLLAARRRSGEGVAA